VLHIATHGIYRQDNPMFSGIRLGDGYLNLYDLYQMRLNANLVTLSGCATGMNFIAAGDELLGLQRGLFCAGATTLLLSLWDVHDQSTAKFMQYFYREFIHTGQMASALQHAMQELRQQILIRTSGPPSSLLAKSLILQGLPRYSAPYIFSLPTSPYARVPIVRPGRWECRGCGKGFWGEEMEHFTTEKWIDFVNQVVATSEKPLMEKHLEQGCKRCMQTVSIWQKLRQSAAAEGNYQPPENSVRLAKARSQAPV